MDLDQYRWNKRVLLLVAPAAQDRLVQEQQAIFEQHRADLDERHLIVVQIVGDSQPQLRERLHLKPNEFTLILIGKDGGEKHRWHSPAPMSAINGLIDRMPMRREEMRNK